MASEREALRALINWRQCATTLPELINRTNRHLKGWSNYFQLGHPRKPFRAINYFVRHRLAQHVKRRSQRGWRVRRGISFYAYMETMGLIRL